MVAVSVPPAGSAWAWARDALRAEFGDAAFELRFSLTSAAAVRVIGAGAPVAARHAEPPEPAAPWSAARGWAGATGWLLGERPPADADRAADVLQRAVERHAAAWRGELLHRRGVLGAELLERLTHRLRTDVSSLQAVAEGALAGVFDADERVQIPGELKGIGAEAQHRLSLVREVMTVLDPESRCSPEPIVEVLRAELDAVGVAVPLAGVEGERPMALVPGAGWAACARLLAAAVAYDERFGGAQAALAVRPDPGGWTVAAGGDDPTADAVAWTERSVGALVHAGEMAVIAGGDATAARDAGGRVRVAITVPAAPSA
jgi:signal transduction histidine kinase